MPKLPPPPDPLSLALLWIGTIIMAIKAGGLPLISGAPLWLASRAWGYLPSVLVTFYIVMAFVRLRTNGEPQMVMSSKNDAADPPVIRETDREAVGLAKADEAKKDYRRVFLPNKITPEYLFELREGKTAAQLNRAIAPYIGKWMIVGGVVQDVAIDAGSAYIHIVSKGQSRIQALGRITTAFFDADFDHLEMYEKGDDVLVYGCIEAIDALGMRLVHSELVS